MRATVLYWAVLLALACAAPAARAQGPWCGRQAPDACGPGFYAANPFGAVYGPNYWVYPGFAPFNGMLPPRSNGGFGGAGFGGNGAGFPSGVPAFPTHPFARSPRDFFMYYDR